MSAFPIRKTVAAFAAALSIFAIGVGPGEDDRAQKSAEIGEKAPGFTLPDLDGKEHTLSDYTADGKIVVLEWFNPECPFVRKHYREDTMTMNKLADKYRDQGVVWFRVNSAAPGKQGGGVDHNKQVAEKWGMKDPMLLDESGTVGKSYGAKNTPTIVIINSDGRLAYWGAIDDDRTAVKPGETNYADQALTQILAGETVSVPETKPYGCGVKY